ncbi:MAG: hypothetical protein OEY79_02630 [Anaplasmataceae bacterium]|nr:hypothetical protein [Candidatus Heimdallarchaeota archaeon]MDH5796418.1 hypothetical protein [Anaplasmataceae bacterium]
MSNVVDKKDLNIKSIVEWISKLTLLEVSDLIKSLCDTLNLPDPSSMPIAIASGGVNDDNPSDNTPVEYNLKYFGCDSDKAGLAIIKVIRTICQEQDHADTNLVAVKKKVESASVDNPLVLATGIEKSVYDRYTKDLLEHGAKLDTK